MATIDILVKTINHKIKLLQQHKSVIKKQFEQLKTLNDDESTIPNEILSNSQFYLRTFKSLDVEYNNFIQEFEKQTNKAQYNKFFEQTKESYKTLKSFKEELVDESMISNIAKETEEEDNSGIEMGREYGKKNTKPSFWRKIFSCSCGNEKDENLIEMTEPKNSVSPL